MATAAVQVERRVGQRFPFLLPVSFRATANGAEGVGFTQDLSSRGVFFLTGTALHEGDEIELTLTMPAEITLGESMRVRCRGHVLRMVKPANKALKLSGQAHAEIPSASNPMAETVPETTPPETTKIAVAVRLEAYEYLPDSAAVSASPRIAVLHTRPDEDGAHFIPPQR